MIPRSSLSYTSYFLSVSMNVFDMNATGCQSPFESSCISTAPVATFDMSDLIWNGFDWSGINSTDSSMNHCFKISKACWHLVVHSNFLSFFVRSFRGQSKVRVMSYELSVKVSQSQEGLYLFHCGRGWPVSYSSKFDRVH